MYYLFNPKKKIPDPVFLNNTLYAFDYDGTLAKINPSIDKAFMSPKTSQLFARLVKHFPVAVISGRSVAELKQLLPVKPCYLIGHHGLETGHQADETADQYRSIVLDWFHELNLQLKEIKNITIEKKDFTLAIHYRNSGIKEKERRLINKVIHELKPEPNIIKGKKIFNMLPTKNVNKGTALLSLKKEQGYKHIFFIGDDITDESVFALSDSQVISIRVGKKNSSKAQYYLKNQSEINKYLSMIINSLH
ncbi:MAG: trehalose-phosphatase [Candidatus Margulisbacteria bacterium]|nr:trehalose-phosphatase [Candidatus Margulisiibacteriota bacterium]